MNENTLIQRTVAASSITAIQVDTQQQSGATVAASLQERTEPNPLSDGNALLTAALQYAERGWAVLPLYTPKDGGCSCKRAGCKSIGKHPRTKNGLSDATTDIAIIRDWWTRWPEANIGILTGTESGLLVLDLDDKHGKRGSDARTIGVGIW